MFWGGDGIAKDQGTWQNGRVSRKQLQVSFSLDGVDQVFGCPRAHFVVGEGHVVSAG